MIHYAIGLIALAGLYAAVAMYLKSVRAAAGHVPESSVVDLPEARLFFGIPNASFGIAYYLLVIVAALVAGKAFIATVAAASLIALGTSIYLATKLIQQRLECSRCWTAHVANALLCPLLIIAAISSR